MLLHDPNVEISVKVAIYGLIFAGEHAGVIVFDRGGRELCVPGVMSRQLVRA